MKQYEICLRSGGVMTAEQPIVKIMSSRGLLWCYDHDGNMQLAVPLSNLAYVTMVDEGG